jgi:hypothetical protein
MHYAQLHVHAWLSGHLLETGGNVDADAQIPVLLHNVDAHNVNITGRVCYLT